MKAVLYQLSYVTEKGLELEPSVRFELTKFLPYQGSALPLGHDGIVCKYGGVL